MKTIFIGNSELSDKFSSVEHSMQVLAHFETIAETFEKLNKGEFLDFDAIVLSSSLYEENNDQEFEKFVESMSPYCFFSILVASAEDFEKQSQAITESVYKHSTITEDLEFYFINSSTVKDSIESAQSHYNQGIHPTVVSRIINPEEFKVSHITASKGGSGMITAFPLY